MARFDERMHANNALREAASESAPYLCKNFNLACAEDKTCIAHILTTTSSAPRKSTGDMSHEPPVSSPCVRDRKRRGKRASKRHSNHLKIGGKFSHLLSINQVEK